MARATASGFTISGLLDKNAATRSDYPIERIPVDEIADHPENTAYSMDDAGIAQLAKSIEKEGLTDLPLVRKLDDGSWQMVSGHRRKAAYAMLAEEDERYAQIPCRIIRGISDEQSVMLLHAANYFVRNLTVTERAAASRALGMEVERMRVENPELSGMRTEDIKGGDHLGADRAKGVRKDDPAPGVAGAQDRRGSCRGVARGGAFRLALGRRRERPRENGTRRAGTALLLVEGASPRQEEDDGVPEESDERVERETSSRRRAEAFGTARKRPARAQALRIESTGRTERAGQAGARGYRGNGRQAPRTNLAPCRRPEGAPAPFPASSLSRIHEIGGGISGTRMRRPAPSLRQTAQGEGHASAEMRECRHAGDAPRP